MYTSPHRKRQYSSPSLSPPISQILSGKIRSPYRPRSPLSGNLQILFLNRDIGFPGAQDFFCNNSLLKSGTRLVGKLRTSTPVLISCSRKRDKNRRKTGGWFLKYRGYSLTQDLDERETIFPLTSRVWTMTPFKDSMMPR